MTKANLKKEITNMIETKYPEGGECVWDALDEAMFDYYFTILGKENELNPDNSSVLFHKSGYTTEVSVETWSILTVVEDKTNERIY